MKTTHNAALVLAPAFILISALVGCSGGSDFQGGDSVGGPAGSAGSGGASVVTAGAAGVGGSPTGGAGHGGPGGAGPSAGAAGVGGGSGTGGANAGMGGHAGVAGGGAGGGVGGGSAGVGGESGGASPGGASGSSGEAGHAGAAGGLQTECTANGPTYRCEANILEVCDVGTGKYDVKATCPPGKNLCDATRGQCDLCTAGQVDPSNGCIDVHNQSVCKDDQSGFGKSQPCINSTYCQAGKCVGCMQDADCAGQSTDCATATCKLGACELTVNDGTKPTDKTNTVCQTWSCDASGIAQPTDTMQGMVVMTVNSCEKTVCDGAGSEVPQFSDAGTIVSDDPMNACKQIACDGSGGTMPANKLPGTPVPGMDSTTCLTIACDGSGGIAKTPTKPATACVQSNGSAGLCDGKGACQQCLPSPVGPACSDGLWCDPNEAPPTNDPNAIFVDPMTGLSTNPGNADAPLDSLDNALFAAFARTGAVHIVLATGHYTALKAGSQLLINITPTASSIEIEGAWLHDNGTWTRSCDATAYGNAQVVASTQSSDTQATLILEKVPFALRSLTVVGPDNSGSTPDQNDASVTSGLNSMAIVAGNGAHTLTAVSVVAKPAQSGGFIQATPTKTSGTACAGGAVTTSLCGTGNPGFLGAPGGPATAIVDAFDSNGIPSTSPSELGVVGNKGLVGQGGLAGSSNTKAYYGGCGYFGGKCNIGVPVDGYVPSTLCGCGGVGGTGGYGGRRGGTSIGISIAPAGKVTSVASLVTASKGGDGGTGASTGGLGANGYPGVVQSLTEGSTASFSCVYSSLNCVQTWSSPVTVSVSSSEGGNGGPGGAGGPGAGGSSYTVANATGGPSQFVPSASTQLVKGTAGAGATGNAKTAPSGNVY